MQITIYHNPRCSKSRRTLELLREHGVDPVVIEYLDTPPSADVLDRILNQLGMEPRDFMRSREPEYGALGLEDPGLDRADLIRAMVDNPRLIQRPVVVAGKRVVIGRPPEAVLNLLGEL